MQWSHNYHAESISPFLNTVFWWRNKKVGNFDEISTTFVVGRGELNQNYLLFWSHHIINYVFLVLLHFIHDEWALACNNNVFVQFCFLWREILQHYLSKLLSLKYLRSFKCVQKKPSLELEDFYQQLWKYQRQLLNFVTDGKKEDITKKSSFQNAF